MLLWEDYNDNTIMHTAAMLNHEKLVRRIVGTQVHEDLICAVQRRNRYGLTPHHLTEDMALKNFLAWVEFQHRCYPLHSPIKVVIFFSDENRPGAQAELRSLTESLRGIEQTTTVIRNPTQDDLYRRIRESQEGENVSALLVVMMSHGNSGTVKLQDGSLPINNVLMQMNSSKLKDVPKVRHLQVQLMMVSEYSGQREGLISLASSARNPIG